ncbi:PAS domain-containing protein [Hymenobacter sp. YC55]|uniref:PAS domain-containing protein n=1 Tax=Hymenobacter sp. YC55 TaxID=3034019 RepID=UPI0023F7ABCD|nr:PAS domain-containing protein [Hymenobacter sp. YC55]MDF7814008.1 PAS domain-containing protein [Hymenobacter sp. YC55]
MADLFSPPSSFPVDLLAAYPQADLLWSVLETSLTGLALYSPIWDAENQLVDFRIDLFNPAAQRMLQQPARPSGTYLQHFPHTLETGVFAFHCSAFLSGQPARLQVNYQGDGLDNYFDLAARRCGNGLLVSFTDTANQPRTAVEAALRESQAREQAARATVETQRQQLTQVLQQAPVAIALLEGPTYRIALANPAVRQIWARTEAQLLEQPLLVALPELDGQGVDTLLDGVLHSGQPYVGTELPFQLQRQGRLDTVYFNFVYQPQRNAQGETTGVLVVASDVTETVAARHLVEAQERETAQLNEELAAVNEELAATNEELQAANEEYLATNARLAQTEQQLRHLNQHLEERVQERTTQLRRQQDRLAQILGQVPAALATLEGPALRYTFFNNAYRSLTGGRAQLGLPFAEVMPELRDQGVLGLLEQVYASGQSVAADEAPIRFYNPTSGELVLQYLDFLYQPLTNEEGQTTSVLVYSVDVTERVRVRQQAQDLQAELLAAAKRQAAERETFYQVFAHTPASIALLRGANHRFEYVNAAYQQLFPDRQLTGRTVAEALPETEEAGFLTQLDNVYRSGDTFFGLELPMHLQPREGHPDQPVYYTFTYQAYRENDQIAGISIFAYDVTDQVRTREQGEQERRQLHRLFMEAPAPIVIMAGPDLVLQLVNPAYQRIFPGRALLGKPVLEALPEIDGTPIHEYLRGVYDTGQTFVAQELPLQLARTEGGPLEELYFTFTYQARRTTQGKVDGVLVFAHEVTDQVQARRIVEESGQHALALAQELSTANEQLRRTNVDLDNFIYTASHDLKAPISNIEGLLYLLQDELPAAVFEEEYVGSTLTRMLEAVERFKRTIEHLTDVSKLQKEYAAPTTLVNLAAVLADVHQDLAPLLQETGAVLVLEVGAVPPVPFSEKNLRSVVYNLLSNALKYRSPNRKPQVDVRGYERAGYVVLEVHDNGLGIDADHVPRLFDMFQRFHSHVEGSGIGLFMVKRMVENAGGRIEVHSQPGVGTTFLVYLPHAVGAAA